MKYKIEEELFKIYPDLRVGIVIGTNLKIGKNNPKIDKLIEKNKIVFQKTFEDKNLQDHPNIKAWREAYKSIGVNPKKRKPSAEALLRRILKNQIFPRINDAVDAYLAVELITFLPIGGYDLTRIKGDIILRRSKGTEKFIPIGSQQEEYTKNGEVIYADRFSVLTRSWNYRDSAHSCITEDTKNIILASEAVYKEIETVQLKKTIEKIVEYERSYCGGEYDIFYLDRATTETYLKR